MSTLDEKLARPVATPGGARASFEQIECMSGAVYAIESDAKGPTLLKRVPWTMHGLGPPQYWRRVQGQKGEVVRFELQPSESLPVAREGT